MNEKTEALCIVAAEIGCDLHNQSYVEGRAIIVQQINGLIMHDFEKLVSILYRLDVSEKKINLLLKGFPSVNAADIITDLIIEREQEKEISRQNFKAPDYDGFGEEKW